MLGHEAIECLLSAAVGKFSEVIDGAEERASDGGADADFES